jgi:hypothetical protein
MNGQRARRFLCVSAFQFFPSSKTIDSLGGAEGTRQDRPSDRMMLMMEHAFKEWRRRRGRRQRGDVGLIELYAVFAAESGRQPEELSAGREERLEVLEKTFPGVRTQPVSDRLLGTRWTLWRCSGRRGGRRPVKHLSYRRCRRLMTRVSGWKSSPRDGRSRILGPIARLLKKPKSGGDGRSRQRVGDSKLWAPVPI